jgi:hypothetical protein
VKSERYKKNNNTNNKKHEDLHLNCPSYYAYQEKYIHAKVVNKGWVKPWWQSIHQ